MLNEEQFSEIKEHLESSQNPLFFFDNDVDGLISFLVLRRFIGRGKGVPIKSFPELDEGYIRRIEELNPDKIFILDKPLVSKGFLEYARQHNLPVIWIDHHPPQNPENVFYYNPLKGIDSLSRPTSYICWKATQKDDWLALIGCIADWHVPEFFDKVAKEYPDIVPKTKDPAEITFNSDLGKLVFILGHGMKDTTTNVMKMLYLLFDVKSPYEILLDKKFEPIRRRYDKLNKFHQKILKKATSQAYGKIVFFKYSGAMALSRGICNELFYLNGQKKIVVVAFVKGDRVNISMSGPEGKDLRVIVAKALEEIHGNGGGHPQACGASIREQDLERFREIVESYA